MTNSWIKQSIFKDNNGDVNIEITAEIYAEDRESYFLTSQFGWGWRHTAYNFYNGDEHDVNWERRIHSYVDRVLNRMGWTRARTVNVLTFTTQFRPGPYGHQPTGFREFSIEIITNKQNYPVRNRLPF